MLEEVPLGWHHLPLYINAITEALKHIERETDRQQQLDAGQRGVYANCAHQPVDVSK